MLFRRFWFAVVAQNFNGPGNRRHQNESSKQASAGIIVNQLRKDRFPLTAMLSRKRMMIDPAMWRAIRGQNTNQGAMSSARKFHKTPACRTSWGKKWNQRLNGFGIG